MNENMPTLPGLGYELDDPASRHPLRDAVLATLKALDDDGLLGPEHAAHAQLALVLADAVARSTGKASAAAMASAQLMACLDALPSRTEQTAGDKFEAWLETILDDAA